MDPVEPISHEAPPAPSAGSEPPPPAPHPRILFKGSYWQRSSRCQYRVDDDASRPAFGPFGLVSKPLASLLERSGRARSWIQGAVSARKAGLASLPSSCLVLGLALGGEDSIFAESRPLYIASGLVIALLAFLLDFEAHRLLRRAIEEFNGDRSPLREPPPDSGVTARDRFLSRAVNAWNVVIILAALPILPIALWVWRRSSTNAILLAGLGISSTPDRVADFILYEALFVALLATAILFRWPEAKRLGAAMAIVLGVVAGLACVLLGFLPALPAEPYPDPAPHHVILFALGLVTTLLGFFRRPSSGAAFALGMIVTFVFSVLAAAAWQKSEFRALGRREESRGFSSDPKEVFPRPFVPLACEVWRSRLETTVSSDTGRELKERGWSLLTELQKCAETPDRLTDVIREHDLFGSCAWDVLDGNFMATRRAARRCGAWSSVGFRDFETGEASEMYRNLLGQIQWTRYLALRSVVAEVEGFPNEGSWRLDALREHEERIEADSLIHFLIRLAAERNEILARRTIFALRKVPLRDDERAAVLHEPKALVERLRRAIRGEQLLAFRACLDNPNVDLLWQLEPKIRFGTSGPLSRIRATSTCRAHILGAGDAIEWLERNVDPAKDRFAWPEARVRFDLADPRYFRTTYGRLLLLVAEERLLLAADSVRRFAAKEGHLPRDPTTEIDDWPTDPFDGRPIRFLPFGESLGLVSSVGADLKDDLGRNLQTGGVFEPDRRHDVGFVFEIARGARTDGR